MRGTAWLAAALLVVVLGAGGCTTPGTSPARVIAPLPGTDACLFIVNVTSWDVVDRTTLIIYAPTPKDAYLVKLFEPVWDLDFRERIGFEGIAHTGQLCGNGDYLIVRGDIPRRVPIVALRRLKPDEVKPLLHPPPKAPAASH